MSRELWADIGLSETQAALVRRSILLFDRVLIQVPSEPFDEKFDQETIDRISADATYLAAHGAASIINVGNPIQPIAYAGQVVPRYEDLSMKLRRAYQEARVYADIVPVRSSRASYMRVEDLRAALGFEIGSRLPIPDDDVPFENLVRLREQPEFRRSLQRLRRWETQVLADALQSSDRIGAISAALKEFDQAVNQYSHLMAEAGFERNSAITNFLVAGAKLLLKYEDLSNWIEVASTFLRARKVFAPSWKSVDASDCAIAGIVFETARGV